MPIVADASVAIRGDLTGFHKDLKGAERATAGLGGRLRDAFSLKNVFKAGAVFGIGSSLPGMVSNVIGLVGDASAEFQNLERATRTVDDIFGSSAVTIREWGETAADAAGLSKREVAESAAVLGSMLQNVGFDAGASADEVIKLQQRGADLAATYGGEASDAINAVGSLLRGEFDTIEKYGVKIKQADINARILSLGLDTSTNASKRNAEAVAALSIFYDQTGDAAGRFGENLDTLSGKLDAGQAKIDNFMASIGEGVAQFQLSAIEDTEQLGLMGEEIGNFFDGIAMNFGSQHVEILRLADETGIGFGEMKERIQTSMNETGQSFEQVVADARLSLGPLPAYSQEQALAAVRAVGDAYVAGGPVVAIEAGKVAGLLPSEIKARDAAIRAAAYDNIVSFAAGILDAQNEPKLAMDALAKAQDTALTRQAEVAYLKGLLTGDELAAGLNDSRPVVRLAAQAARAVVIERLEALGIDASIWGYNIGAEYAHGIDLSRPVVRTAAGGLAEAVRGQIGIRSEPTALDSPLRGITKWGGNIVKTIVKGMDHELSTMTNSARSVAGALAPGGIGSPVSGGTLGSSITVISQSLVPGGPAERRSIIDAITPLVDEGLTRNGRLGRKPRN